MILDADLTMPPEELPKFYEVIASGKAEFANGVRLVYPMDEKAMQFLNLCANKTFGLIFTWLLGQPVKDTLCGTKALSRAHYEKIAANRAYFGDFDPFGDFDLLFGAGADNSDRAARRKDNGSILDWVVGEMASLKRDLGPTDRRRVDQYLENVRELERRIQAIEAKNSSGDERLIPEAPAGVPDSFEEHVKLMFDIQVLAFQSDMTRVVSFKTGRDASSRTFPESGTNKGFHPASHHGGREQAVLEFNMINKYHMAMMPYFLQRLQDTKDADGSLLDNTTIIYGSPMADGNIHNHRRCPLIIMGGSNLHPGGMHLKAPDGTPMADVMLSLLHGYGIDTPNFGDSVAPFSLNTTA
jgi:hypothetical protein